MRAWPPVARFERCCRVVSETTMLTGGWGLFLPTPKGLFYTRYGSKLKASF